MRRSVYCCSSWDLVVISSLRFDRASKAAVEDDRSIVDDALLFLMFEIKEEAAAAGRSVAKREQKAQRINLNLNYSLSI
eukprot:scaffold109993_cov91-Cyclotella_meneghiniana.AAC.1